MDAHDTTSGCVGIIQWTSAEIIWLPFPYSVILVSLTLYRKKSAVNLDWNHNDRKKNQNSNPCMYTINSFKNGVIASPLKKGININTILEVPLKEIPQVPAFQS